MSDDSAKKGMEVRTKLFGEKAAQDGDKFLRNFDEGFATFLNEQLFGTIWSRPGLPIKLRSLLTMTALMALGRGPELRLHMRGALNLGIPPEEIKELIVHVSQYSGVPTAVEAIRAFNEVTAPPKTKE
ncbi:MAG: carboxymuconolactone decarboxylase family protein [Candidatus Binatus sp.]|jgi:alkylhydroperoxidase/carboxymuconolactone decarboxylase family protein YurZ|uniref:carboxymuconolactone decarboxylase family protein n=1 Tax=Candidatus Binatus sp. TaxID=2811406 RepID=UPI003BAF0D65